MKSDIGHDYQTIRRVALDILAGRAEVANFPNQFVELGIGVAKVLQYRETGRLDDNTYALSDGEQVLLSDVFWDLFRQGIITLGGDHAGEFYPYFRVSYLGKRVLEHQNLYFFHDVSTYEKTIRENVVAIDETTLVYAKEAMQAYLSGCVLSATVMIGVAAEDVFDGLLEAISANPTQTARYAPVLKERLVLRRLHRFRETIAKHLSDLPAPLKEGLETNLLGIAELVRNFRNDSGHPSGKVVSREQCYILLHLFVPYCKKVFELREHFISLGPK